MEVIPLNPDERRLYPRHQPVVALFIDATFEDGSRSRAEVLDWSLQGMRLLFRPTQDIHGGGAIAISGADGDQREPARVQWCHHKRHFTVAGIRACGQSFTLQLASGA